jgi:hypothetical protein
MVWKDDRFIGLERWETDGDQPREEGFQLVVCDIRKELVEELTKMGARSKSSPKEAATFRCRDYNASFISA